VLKRECDGWDMPVIPALRRQRPEYHKFKTRLGYIVRPCLKNKKSIKEEM
jgi:hypothetical protein